jgi:hypothetical protein
MKQTHVIFLFILVLVISIYSQSPWQSQAVTRDADGKLHYAIDKELNRIPDFSFAGYKGGGVQLPFLPVVKIISPVPGDNTQNIQAALDEIASRQPDKNGFRGALLLRPGMYPVNSSIVLNASGIVLRGSGSADNPKSNSIIYGTGDEPHQRTLITAGGGNVKAWRARANPKKIAIVSDTIPLGAKTFHEEDASSLSPGDTIIIFHPCTKAWLKKIDFGGVAPEHAALTNNKPAYWKVDEQNILYHRVITGISGSVVTVDVPLYYTFLRAVSPAYIYTLHSPGLVHDIGIENLRVDIETKGGEDEDHVKEAVEFVQAENCWMRDCALLHFMHAGVNTICAKQITIAQCRALDPVSIITGKRRYNFCVSDCSQQILFYRCYAQNGRHHYISNGASTASGIVFLDCISQGIYNASEGHRRWSQALLYDNLQELHANRREKEVTLGLYNRGDMGTGHGWASVHSVAWNYQSGGHAVIIQKPPTAQNYAIGCFGNVTGAHPPAPFDQADGYIEGVNRPNINPRSLYLAQLSERMGKNLEVGNLYAPVSYQEELLPDGK